MSNNKTIDKPDFIVLSLTFNSINFIKKLDTSNMGEIIKLNRMNPVIEAERPYYLVFGSYELEGTLYNKIVDFLNHSNNLDLCLGIIGSGNRNIGPEYLITPKRICREFNLDMIFSFEAAGLSKDVEYMNNYLNDKYGKNEENL